MELCWFYLRVSWEISDIKGTLCKDLSSSDWARLCKNVAPEEEDPQADWKGSHPPGCVYVYIQVASWSSHEHRIQHILWCLLWEAGLPAAWQRAWWHRMRRACSGPCAAHLDRLLLWPGASRSGGQPQAHLPWQPRYPGVPSQLIYPHTAPAATTHQARDAAFCPDTKHVKSLKWLNNSTLIILPFMYWIFTVSAWGGWICLYYTINTDALTWNVLQSQSLQSAISDPIWDLLDTAAFPRHHVCPSHKDGDTKASFTGSIIFDVCQIISQGSKHRHVKFMFCDCIY